MSRMTAPGRLRPLGPIGGLQEGEREERAPSLTLSRLGRVSGASHTELIAPRSVDSRCRPKADAFADQGNEALGSLPSAASGVCGQGYD
jgi:hypothetical protein